MDKEDDPVAYGGLVKAPKVLADVVESVAGAIYIDVNFDLQRLWVVCVYFFFSKSTHVFVSYSRLCDSEVKGFRIVGFLQIFRGLLEPIFTLEDLQQQPQPVSMLFKLCHKHDKRIDIRYWKDGKDSIAGVYLDDEIFASGRAEHKDIAKLIAAKEALGKLSNCMPIEMAIDEDSQEVELEVAKRTLFEICAKKKWPKPIYRYILVLHFRSIHTLEMSCAFSLNCSFLSKIYYLTRTMIQSQIDSIFE